MAFALKAKQIRCPRCDYNGRAKTKGTDIGYWWLSFAILLSSFLFWPLIIFAMVMFFWLLSKPSKKVCPICNLEDQNPD